MGRSREPRRVAPEYVLRGVKTTIHVHEERDEQDFQAGRFDIPVPGQHPTCINTKSRIHRDLVLAISAIAAYEGDSDLPATRRTTSTPVTRRFR